MLDLVCTNIRIMLQEVLTYADPSLTELELGRRERLLNFECCEQIASKDEEKPRFASLQGDQTMVVQEDPGCLDSDLRSSLGCRATRVATYCPSRIV